MRPLPSTSFRSFGVWVFPSLAAFFLVPLVGATAASSLEGSATFGDLVVAGAESLTTPSLAAMTLWPEETALDDRAWTLAARAIAVNWTLREARSVGFDPGGGSGGLFGLTTAERSGEDSYAPASVSLAPDSPAANSLLVAVESSAQLSVLGAHGSSTVQPSPGESWRGGLSGRDENVVSNGSTLRGTYDVPVGMPRGQTFASDAVRVRGDFSLYVWATTVNVTAQNGSVSTYRSSEWDSNVVGEQVHERGLTRQESAQLLRLDVVDGLLILADWQGLLRFSSSSLTAIVDGQVVFNEARAYFESDEYFFRTEDESVSIEGSLVLAVEPDPASDSKLHASVTGVDVKTSIPPTGRVASAETNAPVGDVERASVASQKGNARLATPSLAGWNVVPWIVLGSGILAGGWFLLRRRRRASLSGSLLSDPFMEKILLAEEALVRGDSQAARAVVQDVLRQDALNVDAWFVHGASLMQQGLFDRVVIDLEPVAIRIRDNRSGLAFLLAFSFLRLNKLGRARRWSRVAGLDPDFRQVMELEPQFACLNPRSPQARTRRNQTLVGAATIVDVAYG